MVAALEMLGYADVHHMHSVFANPPEADMWTQAINARFFGRGKPCGREEWGQLLGHCQAVTDAPSVLFAEDLVAAYTDSQVILTNRDQDRWWVSFDRSIGAISGEPGRLILAVLSGTVVTKECGKARFTAHYKRGWAPLCDFLGKDVPTVDFPRTNDTKTMVASSRATITAIFLRFSTRVLLPSALLTGAGFAIYANGAR
ncbi:NAD dependent epimerase [Mycena vulgaris]|nr:NAD dependent epimerase [Mycena vulgaris]